MEGKAATSEANPQDSEKEQSLHPKEEQDPPGFEDGDPANPLNWSPKHKWAIVIILSLLRMNVSLGTTVAAPASPQILASLHSTSALYQTLLISIWELGETVGPFLLGPLSETHGRARVAHAANFAFVAFAAMTAASTNIHMLVAARFLTGASVCASFVGAGVVADMFPRAARGRAMSVLLAANTLGPAVGPVAGSFLGQAAGWRWTFWLPAVLQACWALAFLAVYRETYAPVILARCRRSESSPRTTTVAAAADESAAERWKRIARGVTRPLGLLVRSPVLALVALYSSLTNGLVYIAMTQIGPLFQTRYGFSEGASGAAYLGLFAGKVVGVVFCAFALDYCFKRATRLSRRSRGLHRVDSSSSSAELRLPPVVLAGVAMPIGLFGFGWSVQARDHWLVPIAFTGFVAFASQVTLVSLFNYLVDAWGAFGVSAVSAMLVPRNLSGAFLPLVAPPLLRGLGYGWGLSVLGFVAVAFVPLPLLGMRYGERLRGGGKGRAVEKGVA